MWPFDMWGIDLIEKFSKSRNGHEYLIVKIDYFSKWIEAKPLATPQRKMPSTFFTASYYAGAECLGPSTLIMVLSSQLNSQQNAPAWESSTGSLLLPIPRGTDRLKQ